MYWTSTTSESLPSSCVQHSDHVLSSELFGEAKQLKGFASASPDDDGESGDSAVERLKAQRAAKRARLSTGAGTSTELSPSSSGSSTSALQTGTEGSSGASE